MWKKSGPIPIFVNKALWEHSDTHFKSKFQVVVTKTIHTGKSEIFTIWSFTEKVADKSTKHKSSPDLEHLPIFMV